MIYARVVAQNWMEAQTQEANAPGEQRAEPAEQKAG
jgi:hypothetical protein